MHTSSLKIALVLCAAGAAAPSYGQYAPPSSGGYRAPVYQPYAQPAYAQPTYAQPTYGRGVPQFTASRPMPVAPAVPSFKPVNPPSQTTQRILTANRTPKPTPPALQARSANVPRVASQPNSPKWQPSVGAQDWVQPTPSMGSNYGAGYGGSAPAPVADGGYQGYQPDAYQAGGCGSGGCESGNCYGGCAPSCGVGCGCVSGCLTGCFHSCCAHLHGCCCSCLSSCCCCLGGHDCCCVPWRSTGDLVQHMPFFGTTHGYYYFRPYHVMHVFSQQELATRWGGDPRNPYDNTIFEKVYQQLGVDSRSAQPTLGTVPVNTNNYTTPTPVPMYQPVPQQGPGTVPAPQPGEFVPGPVR